LLWHLLTSGWWQRYLLTLLTAVVTVSRCCWCCRCLMHVGARVYLVC
jgi:hypothetical protein